MRSTTGFAAVLGITLLVAAATSAPDRIADELARWSALVASDTRTDQLWLDAKKSSGPVLSQAEEELRQGRRLVALERLAAAGQSLGAALYVTGRPPEEHKNLAAFEAEWKRMGGVLGDVLSPDGPARTIPAGVHPALARALAELSVSQAREMYDASLEYGRNTEPQYGLYYLGAAQAQRTFLDLARGLPEPPAARAPQLRPLPTEIQGVQADLLAAYRPPAAIDRHGDFIVASAALKEARELDASGQRYAALLRYLQAAQRVGMLRERPSIDLPSVQRALKDAETRFGGATDHSIGRFFVERAQSALATPGGTGETVAAVVAADVLPRYFAALEPARPAATAAPATVTVTLVRWPFT